MDCHSDHRAEGWNQVINGLVFAERKERVKMPPKEKSHVGRLCVPLAIHPQGPLLERPLQDAQEGFPGPFTEIRHTNICCF